MNVSLDGLRVLDAIERTGSFAAAADELHRVASAVTYSVKQLEAALGTPLFDRSGYRAELTPAGRELLDGGRFLLEKAELLERKIKVAAGIAQPNLSISYDDALGLGKIEGALKIFFEKFPDTSVNLYAEVLNGCKDALLSGRSDLVIGSISEFPTGASFKSERIESISWLFAVAPDHPLAQVNEPLSAQDIVAHRIVVIPDTSRNLTKAASGYAPDRQFLSVPSMEAKIAAQIAGLGVGFLPSELVKAHIKNGRLVEKQVDRPKVGAPCYVAWKDEAKGPGLTALVELLKKQLA